MYIDIQDATPKAFFTNHLHCFARTRLWLSKQPVASSFQLFNVARIAAGRQCKQKLLTWKRLFVVLLSIVLSSLNSINCLQLPCLYISSSNCQCFDIKLIVTPCPHVAQCDFRMNGSGLSSTFRNSKFHEIYSFCVAQLMYIKKSLYFWCCLLLKAGYNLSWFVIAWQIVSRKFS